MKRPDSISEKMKVVKDPEFNKYKTEHNAKVELLSSQLKPSNKLSSEKRTAIQGQLTDLMNRDVKKTSKKTKKITDSVNPDIFKPNKIIEFIKKGIKEVKENPWGATPKAPAEEVEKKVEKPKKKEKKENFYESLRRDIEGAFNKFEGFEKK